MFGLLEIITTIVSFPMYDTLTISPVRVSPEFPDDLVDLLHLDVVVVHNRPGNNKPPK